jgi:hypothetical protein
MNAINAKVGEKYLTKSGIPVVATRRDGDKLVLRVETTGNEAKVEKDYALQAFDESKVSKDAKALLKANGKASGPKAKRGPREGTISAAIDPLLNGKFTLKEIVAKLKKEAPELAKQTADLAACVRARCVGWRRKGATIERDAKNHLKLVLPKGTPAAAKTKKASHAR